MVDRVVCYRAPSTVADANAVVDWLGERVDADVTVRPRFLAEHADEGLARAFARARVLSPYRPETGNEMLGVVRYEERALDRPERAGGVLYDGFALQRALNARLPAAERGLDTGHVVLLDRAIGTWGGDGRWHKRVAVHGHPSLVSVPGLYEAPAKPEAYYQAKQSAALVGGDPPPREVLEREIEGDFLVEDDPRTTEAIRGYALQAVHLLATGEGFCPDERCCLFDAHHQAALVRAQLAPPAFCETHAERYG